MPLYIILLLLGFISKNTLFTADLAHQDEIMRLRYEITLAEGALRVNPHRKVARDVKEFKQHIDAAKEIAISPTGKLSVQEQLAISKKLDTELEQAQAIVAAQLTASRVRSNSDAAQRTLSLTRQLSNEFKRSVSQDPAPYSAPPRIVEGFDWEGAFAGLHDGDHEEDLQHWADVFDHQAELNDAQE